MVSLSVKPCILYFQMDSDAQFRQSFASDVELLNDQVGENRNHMNTICEMGNVMYSITEEQDLMITRLDNNYSILFARMKVVVSVFCIFLTFALGNSGKYHRFG